MTDRRLIPLQQAIEAAATPDQARAILSETNLTVVSAGAGTGKTWTLAQRYLWALAQGCLPSEILTLTFTEKAAAEMAERINALIGQSAETYRHSSPALAEHLRRCAAAMAEAQITTIHSFSYGLIKTEGLALGIEPATRILNPAEEVEFWAETATALNRLDDGSLTRTTPFAGLLADQSVADLIEAFGGENLVELARAVIGNEASKGLTPLDLWNDSRRAEGAILKLKPIIESRLRAAGKPFVDALESSDHPKIRENLTALCRDFPGQSDDPALWDGAFVNALAEKINLRIPAFKNSLPFDDPSAAKKTLKNLAPLADVMQQGFSPEESRLSRNLAKLCALLWQAYKERKAALGALTFDDMIAGAADLARTFPQLGKAYRHVLVDEYQDTDGLQDRLVTALAGKHAKVFLVGDIKQSIYRFRHAEPSLFDRRGAQAASKGRYVALRHNFRSSAPVLEWINTLFGAVFENGVASGLSAGYEALVPGASSPLPERPLPLGEWLLDSNTDMKSAERRLNLARRLFATLKTCIENKMQVRYKEGLRPLQWSDVAILTRSRTAYPMLKRAAAEAGVPVTFEGLKDFYSQYDITDFIAVLQSLKAAEPSTADPAFLSYLCSCYGGLTTGETERILSDRKADTEGLRTPEALAALARWRRMKEATTFGGGLAAAGELLADPSWMATLLPHKRRGAKANLRRVMDLLEEYGRVFGPSLAGQTRYLQLAPRWSDGTAHPPQREKDRVKVLTVHASKGLEFPLVVVFDTECTPGGKAPAGLFASSTLIAGSTVRPGAAADDGDKPRLSAAHRLFEERFEAEEHARLYYVALTRARDGVLLCGLMGDRPPAGSWMELETLRPHSDRQLFEQALSRGAETPDASRQTRPTLEEEQAETAPPEQIALLPRGRRKLVKIPATALALWHYCPMAWRQTHRQGVELRWWLHRTADGEPGGAELGTLTHWALSRWDFALPFDINAHAAGAPLIIHSTLKRRGAAERVHRWLEELAQSEALKEIIRAQNRGCLLRREWPLAATLPEGVKLTGVVDLAWQDKSGVWHLRDWKTTRRAFRGASKLLATWQLQTYVALLALSGQGTKFDPAVIALRGGETHSVEWDDTTTRRITEAALTAAALAPDGPWPPRLDRCAACPWRMDCPKE